MNATLPSVIPVADHTWLAASKASPGDYHTVTYSKEKLTCSCPNGKFRAKQGQNAACRHVRLVLDWLDAQRAPECRYSNVPGHVHRRRDGRECQPSACHMEARAQLEDESHLRREVDSAVVGS